MAIKAIEDQIGGSPSELHLIGYKAQNTAYYDEADLDEPISEIEQEPEDDRGIAGVIHLFLIEADGRTFKVMVRPGRVQLLEI